MKRIGGVAIAAVLAIAGCSSDTDGAASTSSSAGSDGKITTVATPSETARGSADSSAAASTDSAESSSPATSATGDTEASDTATSDTGTSDTGTSDTGTSATPDTTAPAVAETSAPGTDAPAAEIAVAPSAGCSAAPVPGDSTVPFTAAGMPGSYILHVPASAQRDEPLPLVLDLHGYSEPAAVHVVQSGLAPFGDTAGFVTVAPAIDRPVPRWDATPGSPDVEWVGALLDELGATLCVDTNRVFAAGLSNGAFMVSTLACDLSDRLAAVAPVAGIQAPDGCAPTRPVPVIAFHGTADTFVPFEGGLGSSVANLPTPDGSGTIGTGASTTGQGPSVLDRTVTWALRNGCDGTPTEEAVATDVTLVRFDCASGADVELYRVEGGGHSWPGSAFSQQIVDIVGPTTTSISATALMWDFFAAHPLAG